MASTIIEQSSSPSTATIPPVPISPKISESKALENEAKDLLSGRFGEKSVGRRCAVYTPTLEELKSTSFSDYIRAEVLGVYPVTTPPSKLPPRKDDSCKRVSTRSRSKQRVPPEKSIQPPKYQMCWYKLRDGIAKVSLPDGFWSKMDSTGRGRHWAEGSELGDTVIPSPIKQALAGMGGVYEYTLVEQPPVSVADFRTKADGYRMRQIGKEFDEDDSDEFCNDLARRFWRRLGPTMEPSTYGADMEGSLFRRADACGWNIDRLESCLCLLGVDAGEGESDDEVFRLPGVTSAYLYFGMWGSAFAAHTEDMNLLSINYLHAGAPKFWYAIAQEDSKRFESLAQSHFAAQAAECSEFLRHKQCVLSPAILKKAGIRFTTSVQRPGDVVITFPGSYHFGFNTGFNVAESTNFGVPEWIPYGEQAGVCLCQPHSVRIQMKRLKSLLNCYDNDMCVRASAGLEGLNYTQWAKQEAKRMKESKACQDDDKEVMTLPTKLNATIAVEVTKEQRVTNKRNKKRSFKRREYIEWRLAKRVRPSALIPGATVICAVESDGRDSDYETFIGSIVSLVDGYVRVHMYGLARKADIWFEQDSLNLFLDGGITDPPKKNKDDNKDEKPDDQNSKRSKK